MHRHSGPGRQQPSENLCACCHPRWDGLAASPRQRLPPGMEQTAAREGSNLVGVWREQLQAPTGISPLADQHAQGSAGDAVRSWRQLAPSGVPRWSSRGERSERGRVPMVRFGGQRQSILERRIKRGEQNPQLRFKCLDPVARGEMQTPCHLAGNRGADGSSGLL